MKQYNTNQKKKIVEIINKVKNKKVQALKIKKFRLSNLILVLELIIIGRKN